jgi:hypothetical protein
VTTILDVHSTLMFFAGPLQLESPVLQMLHSKNRGRSP